VEVFDEVRALASINCADALVLQLVCRARPQVSGLLCTFNLVGVFVNPHPRMGAQRAGCLWELHVSLMQPTWVVMTYRCIVSCNHELYVPADNPVYHLTSFPVYLRLLNRVCTTMTVMAPCIHYLTDCCGACLGVLQADVVVFARCCVDAIRNLLQLVSSSEGAEPLEQQLLSGQASQLMATILDGMLAALQVSTRQATIAAQTPNMRRLRVSKSLNTGNNAPGCCCCALTASVKVAEMVEDMGARGFVAACQLRRSEQHWRDTPSTYHHLGAASTTAMARRWQEQCTARCIATRGYVDTGPPTRLVHCHRRQHLTGWQHQSTSRQQLWRVRGRHALRLVGRVCGGSRTIIKATAARTATLPPPTCWGRSKEGPPPSQSAPSQSQLQQLQPNPTGVESIDTHGRCRWTQHGQVAAAGLVPNQLSVPMRTNTPGITIVQQR
jgi:hypothetical protein